MKQERERERERESTRLWSLCNYTSCVATHGLHERGKSREEGRKGRRGGRKKGREEKGRRGEGEGDIKPAWIHRASPHILMVLPVIGGGKFKVQNLQVWVVPFS